MMSLLTTCLHSQSQTTPETPSFMAPVYLTRFSVCLFMCFMSTVPPWGGTGPVPSSQLMELWVASCRLQRNICWEMIEFLFLGLIWLSRWMNICVNISRVKGVGNLLLGIVFPVGSLDLKRGCQTSTKAPQTQQEACRQIVYHLICQGSPKEKHQLPYQGLGVPMKWWPVFPLPGRIFRESSLERFSGEGKKLATSSWFKERIKNGNVNQYFQCQTWKAAKEVSENSPTESEIR